MSEASRSKSDRRAHTTPSIAISRLLTVVMMGACMPPLLALWGRESWRLELFTHFPAYYAAMLGAAAAALFVSRRPVLGGVAGLFAAHQAWLVFSLSMGAPPSSANPQAARRLRLVVVNVNTANRSYGLVERHLHSEDPDVVVLLEVDQRWLAALAPVTRDHSVRHEVPRSDNFGMALFSRLPGEAETLSLRGLGAPTLRATLRAENGTKITLFGAHPPPPVTEELARLRDEHLDHLAELAAATAGPVVVAGDLNATPWSPAIADFVEASRLRDTRKGLGVLPTWFVMGGAVQIPIDYVLVSDAVGVTALRVGPDIGSDHRGLVADLVVGP